MSRKYFNGNAFYIAISGTPSCPRLELYTTSYTVEQTLQQGSCVAVPPQTTFTTQLIAVSGSSDVSIVDIETSLPSGATVGNLTQIPYSNSYYVNVTWAPQASQQNQTHMLCFSAVRSNGLTIDEFCISLLPGYFPPSPIRATATPNQQLVYPSNTTWHIIFDRSIQRPSRMSYITFHEFSSEQEVYRIDVSQSQEVAFESNGISITPNFRFTEQTQFNIKFDRAIVRGLELCGPESEPLVDKNYWTFETRDITPPEVEFLQNPAVSNENISISWRTNENVTWECVLTYGSLESAVNCSDGYWQGDGLSGGSYVLSVQATDNAGNIARYAHHFEVDLTPPISTITATPRPISNEQSFMLAFSCNEVCSYQCYFIANMSMESHSFCNSGTFATPLLLPNTNYTLVIVATDQLGNTGERTSYSWETDFEAPVITVPQNLSGLCGSTGPEQIGQAQVSDNRPESVSLTYRDVQTGCSIRRTWTATDRAGNVDQQVQVINIDFSPVVSLSAFLTLPCDSTASSIEVSSSTATAPNPCRLPVQLTFEDSISRYACPSNFVRNWMVTSCGRSTSELQTITLYDVCPPHACGRNETIPRGICSFGQCYCNRPWYGEDCEILIYEPVALPVNDATLQEIQEYTTSVSLSQGTPPLSWLLLSGPRQLQVNQLTGQVTWSRAQAGNHSISVLIQNEVGEARVHWTLQVTPGYTARVNPVSPSMFPYPQSVTITGCVEYALNSSVESELGGIVPVEVSVTSNGASRAYIVYTMSDGNFSLTFYPASTEYGTYMATARHPGSAATSSQTEWSILGMTARPRSIVLRGESFDGGFSSTFYNVTFIYNDGPGTLTGLSATPQLGNARGISITASLQGANSNDTLQHGEQLAMDIRVVSSRIVRGAFLVIIEASEGTRLQLIASLRIEAVLPLFQIDPPRVDTRIVRGTSRTFEFNVTNIGRNMATNVRALLPNSNFISFTSFGNTQQSGGSLNLGAGESALLTLQAQTPATQQLGELDISVVVRSNEVPTTIPISLIVSSDLLMNLTVVVQDEYTYFAAGQPLVDDARITMINYQRNLRLRLTTAADNGTATFVNIYEDRYEMYVEAPGHRTLHQVTVTSITNPTVTVFIERQAVRYTWSVTPVTYEDVYVIPVVTEFETHVPIPVVTVDPTEINLADLESGRLTSIQINITNHGLVRADNVSLQLPTHPSLVFSTTNEELGNLEPLSSVIVTVRSSTRSSQKRAVQIDFVIYAISVLYSYVCNVPIYQSIPVIIKEPIVPIVRIPEVIEELIEIRLPERQRQQQQQRPTPIIVPEIGFDDIETPTIEQFPSDSFNGFTSITDILCNSCFDSLLICITPSLSLLPHIEETITNLLNIDGLPPLAGCIRSLANSIDEGENPFWIALKWFECALGNRWTGYLTCFVDEGVFDKCLDLLRNITSDSTSTTTRRRRNAGEQVLNDLVEALYPIQQNVALGTEVLGDDMWIFSVNDPRWLSNTLRPTLDDQSEAGVLVSPGELSTILFAPPPNGTTIAMVARMVERINNTISGWNNGQLEPLNGANMASFSAVQQFAQNINNSNELALRKGFPSYVDAYIFARGEINRMSNIEDEVGVCAVVRIRIVQELALTREAFEARLEIENQETSPLQQIDIEIVIKDALTGNLATHLFSIGNGTLSGSVTIMNNGWMLPSDASGTIAWLIIPYSEAAPETDHIYTVGGSFNYVVDGENITVPLLPTPITVRPDPSLLVHYFLDRYVQGDDPLTEAREPSAPFTLGVAVKNAGYGTAHSLRISSGQPEIIDNERGLLITFMIIGANMGRQSISPSLTVMFGDLTPNTTSVARWYMLSSLKGEFTSYSATFENRNPLGDPRLSILDELETHVLVRNVMMYNDDEDDGILDFLVNDRNDFLEYPDGLYSSRTLEQHNVSIGTVQSVDTMSDNTTTSLLVRTTSNTTGWVYYRYEDSQGLLGRTAASLNGTKTIADQTVNLPPENSWITSDRDAESGTETHYLHILDYITMNDVMYNMELCSVDCDDPIIEMPEKCKNKM